MIRVPRPTDQTRPVRPARAVARSLVVGVGVALLAWLPALASAAPLDDLPGRAGSFSVTDGILIFGLAPVGTFLLIALVVMRPGQAPKAQRYRPGRDWSAAPNWSGLQPPARSSANRALPASDQAVPVMDGAQPSQPAASTPEQHGAGTAAPSRPAGGRSRGGASGSW